jgi:hypothetical protein
VLKAYIDLIDLDKLINFKYSWHVSYIKSSDTYYARSTVYEGYGKSNSKMLYMHRFIMGTYENGIDVDHIDGDGLENRRFNLRPTETIFNLFNRTKINSNNTSGYRNVSLDKRTNEWIVQLQINRKNKVLGRFPYDQLEEAGKFAEEMRKKYYGDFAGIGQ